MTARTLSAFHYAAVLLLAALGVGCSNERPRQASNESEVLTARVIGRTSLRTIALDRLSDSARVIRLLAAPTGNTLAFTFADPTRDIAYGLGIIQPGRDSSARLAWPDSVRTVQWQSSTELVFSAGTGGGVYIILDVHSDSLVAVRDTGTRQLPDSLIADRPRQVDSGLRARITRFVDSLHTQPTGVPQEGQLRYGTTRIIPAPRDSTAAFYVTARDSQMNETNPAWYIVDLRTGGIAPVDSLIGNAAPLPAEAATWLNDSTFYFTKDFTLHEVRLQRIRP